MKIAKEDVEKFRTHLIEEEKEPGTVGLYLSVVEQFMAFLQGQEVSKERVLAYKALLIDRYAPATVNSKLGTINLFLRFCNQTDACVRRLRIQRQFYLPEEKRMGYEDYTHLVNEAEKQGDRRLALCLQILCATGIRVGELPFVTVEAAKRGRAEVYYKGKSRVILMPESLCQKISAYAAREKITAGPVIRSATGRPLDRTSIWRQMNRLCIEAGISAGKGHPHALRHLFAVTYYQANRDPIGLADLLGHSSIDTTRIYTATGGEEKARQLEKMGLVL